jgi:succinate dehydrogenase / fumarate reductase flavoprotein subunit
MGGIPTNRHGQVVRPDENGTEQAVEGLYAVGECACVSVHGANRLGGNSLLDIVVFGRAAARHMLRHLEAHRYHRPLPRRAIADARALGEAIDARESGESVAALRRELQQTMEDYAGVFRRQDQLDSGLERMRDIHARSRRLAIGDHGRVFNTARIEALELANLADVALAAITSAAARTESRGAHSRVDHPDRDDEHWLVHSLFSLERGMHYKPVRTTPLTVDAFPPKPRVY